MKKSQSKKSGMEITFSPKNANTERLTSKKKLVKTVDCTPDWVGLAPLYIEWIQSGNSVQHQTASEHITQMAKLSDAYRKALPVIKMHDELMEVYNKFNSFFDEMPKGQLGKIVCDIGLLNEAFIASSKVKQLLKQAEGKSK